jgi:hypothetical protein
MRALNVASSATAFVALVMLNRESSA